MAHFPRILLIVAQKASTGVLAPPPEAVIVVETNYVPILATLICALICTLGLVVVFRYTLLCCLRSTSGTNASRGPLSPPHKGLQKKVLQSLPKINYSTTTNSPVNLKQLGPSSPTKRAICLVEFVEGDEMRVLPQCGHGFLVACIDKWLSSHSSCPS